MNRTLYILRSVSGAGKSTLAEKLLQLPNSVAFAADDYFTNREGLYKWDASKITRAHDWCQVEVCHAMFQCTPNIIVHNTNTSEKEIKPYLELANEYGYTVVSLVVENRHRGKNIHNVPDETLDKQERRLRNSIVLR